MTTKKSRVPPNTTVNVSTREILPDDELLRAHPAPVPEEPAPRQPGWSGPPENVVGATVPFDLVLVNSGDVAVAVGGMTA
jgi:hypothetical protein